MDRHVRYNCQRAETNPDCLKWWFLIINQNRDIRGTEQKIYNLLAMIEEEEKPIEGIVKKSGLRFKLISFESRKKVEDYRLKEIHKKVIKDLRLYNRKNPDGLENYLLNQFGG